jgi:valyl-tRNA synthetase
VTEEIYTKLYNIDESIMISEFPTFNTDWDFATEEKEVAKLKEIIVEIRNLRANLNVHPSKKSELIFVTKTAKNLITKSEGFLKKLGFSEKITIQEDKTGIAQNAMSVLTEGIEVYIPFEELVDIEEERKRLEEEKKKVLAEIERATKMLSNPGFVNKAPEAKINEEKAKLAKYKEMLNSIEERL